MKIERRKIIDDGIMAELQKKHPVKSEKGVCYAQDMDYITLEVEAFNNSTFRKLVKANNKVLVVYMYLRLLSTSERPGAHGGVWALDLQ